MRAVRSRSQARGTHLWTDETRSAVVVALNIAQGIRGARPGVSRVRSAGEDADPTYLTHPDGGRLLAVYDGMGGAGARVLVHSDGRAYSEAYFASRRVRTAVEEWFLGSPGTYEVDGVDDLQAAIHHSVDSLRRQLPVLRSSVSGSMGRALPTTLAALVVGPHQTHGRPRPLTAIWAGDSRAFVLTAANGLQQLTTDHVRDGDVMSQLVNDAPLNNVISASHRFELACQVLDVPDPFIAVCATDGVFGYVRTPGEVEHLLLDSLILADSPESWARRLARQVGRITGDDASLVAAAIGFDSFDELRTSLVDRAVTVAHDQHDPFAGVAPGSPQFQELRDATWQRYRAGYEARMPPRSRGAGLPARRSAPA
jgi:serine/threonine protein phosphatase PrpC